MNKKHNIILLLSLAFSICYAQKKDSIVQLNKAKTAFFIENDISGAINFLINSKTSANKIYYNFINGGIGLSLQKKQDRILSSDFYISYYYIVSFRNFNVQQKDYTTGIGYFKEEEIYKNIFLEHRLFYNKKNGNCGFYTNVGIGIGQYCHTMDNLIIVKKQNWNIIGGFGYKYNIKRFFVDAHFSLLTLFTYRDIQDYHKDISGYGNFPLTYGQDANSINYVKKLEFDGNSKITRTYKYGGIVNSGFLPRFGINIGFKF